MDAGERIGGPAYIPCDPEKIAAVVLTQAAEKPRPLAPADRRQAGPSQIASWRC
jgi:acyl-CoA hydrolase